MTGSNVDLASWEWAEPAPAQVPPRFSRGRIAAAAAVVLILLGGVLWVRRPGPLRTPDRIGALERLDEGVAVDIEQGLREIAQSERRIGDPVVAVYGDPADALPTVAVVAGVIKIGHGDEIVSTFINGLAVGGIQVGGPRPAGGGRHGGSFSCGDLSSGELRGTYCTWHDQRTVGAIAVYGRDPADAQALAARVRDAVQR